MKICEEPEKEESRLIPLPTTNPFAKSTDRNRRTFRAQLTAFILFVKELLKVIYECGKTGSRAQSSQPQDFFYNHSVRGSQSNAENNRK